MRREAKKLLYDICVAADYLEQFVVGKSLHDFGEDELLKSAVERKFEIIGEADTQLSRLDPETVGRISEYRRIISLRNILVHGYTMVDDRIVWDLLEIKLPMLRKEAQDLLDEPL